MERVDYDLARYEESGFLNEDQLVEAYDAVEEEIESFTTSKKTLVDLLDNSFSTSEDAVINGIDDILNKLELLKEEIAGKIND